MFVTSVSESFSVRSRVKCPATRPSFPFWAGLDRDNQKVLKTVRTPRSNLTVSQVDSELGGIVSTTKEIQEDSAEYGHSLCRVDTQHVGCARAYCNPLFNVPPESRLRSAPVLECRTGGR